MRNRQLFYPIMWHPCLPFSIIKDTLHALWAKFINETLARFLSQLFHSQGIKRRCWKGQGCEATALSGWGGGGIAWKKDGSNRISLERHPTSPAWAILWIRNQEPQVRMYGNGVYWLLSLGTGVLLHEDGWEVTGSPVDAKSEISMPKVRGAVNLVHSQNINPSRHPPDSGTSPGRLPTIMFLHLIFIRLYLIKQSQSE